MTKQTESKWKNAASFWMGIIGTIGTLLSLAFVDGPEILKQIKSMEWYNYVAALTVGLMFYVIGILIKKTVSTQVEKSFSLAGSNFEQRISAAEGKVGKSSINVTQESFDSLKKRVDELEREIFIRGQIYDYIGRWYFQDKAERNGKRAYEYANEVYRWVGAKIDEEYPKISVEDKRKLMSKYLNLS